MLQSFWHQRAFTYVCLVYFVLVGSDGLSQGLEDQGQGPALAPIESQKLFNVDPSCEWTQLLTEPTIEQPLMATFDSRGRLWVVEYRQYPEPAGLKPLSRDNFWRIVYDAMPLPPGKGGLPGKDRISIHEDRDSDGTLETHSTFVDGLNIATAVLPTEKGAWVLNPPYLLFYHDKDGNSVADGSPDIHLEGFGLEDTHSVVNSLCMGPDGWLYAAQGSTVSGAVRKFQSTDEPIKTLGQAIWRYHPTTHQYEVFAEGGGNAFGVAMSDRGEIFSGHNGGDTRGFHYYQGGYYRKGFDKHGSLSNPNAFGYLNPMHHPPLQRFTHTMLLTEGTAFADSFPGSMLAVDPLHGKLIQTELKSTGSTYETIDVRDVISSEDKWFRPVAIVDGPDGCAYVCDWYDFQVAHLYAHQGKMDREHGRVYRLSPQASSRDSGSTPDQPSTDRTVAAGWDAKLANASSDASLVYLLDRLECSIRWQRWMARRLIAAHPLKDSIKSVIVGKISVGEYPLEYLWTAHVCGWLHDTIGCERADSTSQLGIFNHPDASVRGWLIRLVCDDGQVTSEVNESLVVRARTEEDPSVLCQIASSAKRLPPGSALAIVRALLSRPLPENDPFFPMLLWWAVEKHSNRPDLVAETLLSDPSLWENAVARNVIFPNLIRRWCSSPSPSETAACTQLLRSIHKLTGAARVDAATNAVTAFEKAYQGKSLQGVSNEMIDALLQLGQPSITLRLRRGDKEAITDAAKELTNRSSPPSVRIQIAKIAGEFRDTTAIAPLLPVLLGVALDQDDNLMVREATIAALAIFDKSEVASSIIAGWRQLPDALRPTASALLASRESWSQTWIESCLGDLVEASSLSLEAIRAMRQHANQNVQEGLNRLYPETSTIDFAVAQRRSGELTSLVLSGNGDPYRGKKHFKSLCGRCHKLFDDGGDIGPDLTGYQRDQLPTLVRNIIAPSLEVREGYRTIQLLTEDDRVLSGFIESQTKDQVVVKTIDGLSHTLDMTDVASMKGQLQSLMPEGLLDNLTDQEIIDLVSYLRSSQPLSDG